MAGKPKRARSDRRAADRDLRKQIEQRQRLTVAAPGGAQDHPLSVTSAAVIEGRARSLPCLQCGGELDLRTHEAPDAHHRLVKLVCRLCHTPRSIWFRLEPPLTN